MTIPSAGSARRTSAGFARILGDRMFVVAVYVYVKPENVEQFKAAILDNAPLVTRNLKHFSRVPGLRVLGY